MAEVKVARDGVVTRDGVRIGRVVKEVKKGMFETMFGASASASGTPEWHAETEGGERLPDRFGYDTRKRAVELLDRVTRPTEIGTPQVESVSWPTFRRFVSAGVNHLGFRLQVSRYADEDHWIIDMLIRPEAFMPTFSNGGGSRVTTAHVLNDSLAELVTAKAVAAGVWPLVEG